MNTLEVSTISEGKRSELQRRDALHLEIARGIFLHEGYHSLTISRLAKATGFSRPTLYERFNSKEQLIVELGLRCQEELIAFMEGARSFPGRPRERMVAIGEVIRHYADRYTDDLRISNFSGTDFVLEKVPPGLRDRYTNLDMQLLALIQGTVEEAVESGDLLCPPGTSARSLTLTLIALFEGLASVQRGLAMLEHLAIADPVAEIIRSAHMLLDGYGWRPLSSEWDYAETERRIRAEVIAGMKGGALD
ncbi:MAG: TetR/AcrR family transcriptional regulator [Candidatus Hydrogenedentes bacterium]|nr:TetR/AcrR family transcriptional regulator [Candidatus Hydrogenedentota bacterium]